MKLERQKIVTFLVLISLVGLGLGQTQTKYIIGVNGLTCPFCAYGLEKKLKKVKGVESVRVDLENDEAVVTIKTGETVEAGSLRKAVRRAGFSVASLEKVESDLESDGPGSGRAAAKGSRK